MIDCSLHTITHLIWKNANFIVRKIKIQKQNLYFFPVFFLDSNHYIIPVCVLNVPINERTERIFSHFFHRIFGQFTWLNGILVLRKTMIITENYMSEFERRKKTHHRFDVLSKSLTVIEQLNTMRRVHRIHVPKKHRETNHRKAKEWKTEQLHPISHREKKIWSVLRPHTLTVQRVRHSA